MQYLELIQSLPRVDLAIIAYGLVSVPPLIVAVWMVWRP